jgi:hypothetical protein
MTDLAQLQRGLLSLLKARPIAAPTDTYFERVAASNELSLAREIALWWRAYSLETYCVFTSTLLKRFGLFDKVIEAFFCSAATSPFIEQLSQDFLMWVSGHRDPLVASIASFERALLRVKRGDSRVYQLEWNRNPESLMSAILQGRELPRVETDRVYRMTISASIPKLVSCEVITAESRVGTAPSSKVSCTDTRRATG